LVKSSGAGTRLGPGSALSAEIPIQRVDSRVQNQVTIGAIFEMTLDLAFDRRGESPL
jgi:hypothetical protein